MRMFRRRTLFIVPAVMVVTVATLVFGVFGSSSIDGFTAGVMEKCAGLDDDPSVDASCGGGYRLARAALDARDPGHASVVSLEMYSDGTQPGPIDVTGPGLPPTPAPRHPGPDVTVFVFKLADGSTRATGVACTKEAGQRTSCTGIGSYPN